MEKPCLRDSMGLALGAEPVGLVGGLVEPEGPTR